MHSRHPNTTAGQFTRSAPYFPVAEVERSVEHYTRVLGFNLEYSAGSPAQFAIVTRDGLAIMLRRVADPAKIAPSESQGGTWDAFFWVRDVDALAEELRARGATIVYGPIVQEAYHMKELAARDVDGHVLGFGEPVS
jgi:catechol 2,3-dioxygenase-like lactoylglutathione lyase family enzyme